MRKEIEEIISNGECHVIFSEGRIEFTDEIIGNMADKILSLFEKKIDSMKEDIRINIDSKYSFGYSCCMELAQDIINIIKSKVKE